MRTSRSIDRSGHAPARSQVHTKHNKTRPAARAGALAAADAADADAAAAHRLGVCVCGGPVGGRRAAAWEGRKDGWIGWRRSVDLNGL